MIKYIMALLLLSILFVKAGYADSTWRCNSNLVSLGDTKAMVIAKCGNPSTTDLVYYKKDRNNNNTGLTQNKSVMEGLTYIENEHRVFRTLKFENGKLIEITSHYK